MKHILLILLLATAPLAAAPNDCLISALETHLRLKKAGAWSCIIGATWFEPIKGEEGKYRGAGHAFTVYQVGQGVWVYDPNKGSVPMPERFEKLLPEGSYLSSTKVIAE